MHEQLSEIKSARADPRMAALLADYPEELFSDRLYRITELVDGYCLALAIDLVDVLEIRPLLTEWRSVEEISAIRGFTSRFSIALAWLLDRLVADRIVTVRDHGATRTYRNEGSWPQSRRKEVKTLAGEIDPSSAASFDLLDAAAAAYPGVASGEIKADEVLLGMGSVGLWLGYFSNSNPLYAVNNRVAAIAATQGLGQCRKLRILEIGAGAGSGTEALLTTLAERELLDRLEVYRVTEPSAFLRRKSQRALTAAYPGAPLEFAALDMDLPWRDQGVSPGSFDLIFGVNVLHVANDLLASLGQARATLAPGGILAAGECIRPFAGHPISIEFVFQILDSFTEVITDPEIRPQPGFLTIEQWGEALRRAGFGSVEFAPDHAKIREIYPRFLVGALRAH
jgi:SAM-dependent methyltransferase